MRSAISGNGGEDQTLLHPLQPQKIKVLDGSTSKNRIASLITSIATCKNLLKPFKAVNTGLTCRMQWVVMVATMVAIAQNKVRGSDTGKIKGLSWMQCNFQNFRRREK
jgi:hypothetical protein